jgi:peptidoglycan-associated lipoprotein
MVNSEGGTRLPGGDGGNVGSTPVKPATDTTGGVGFTGPGHEGWTPNAEIFKQYTVYFDFDSSAIRGGERTKVGSIADYLKSNAAHAVKIEGHCDERGTEEYNRALGERRALALREELVKLGIDPTRLDTVSFGKDRPAVQGQNEDAWSKNRRGEFVLLTPPAAP